MSLDDFAALCTKNIWCFHCCHAFDGEPVRLPTNHDPRTDVWTYTGTFCSWSCAKSWNHADGRDYRSGIRGQLLTLLKKRTTGTLSRTVPAPPRVCLKVFGGTMTIEEFRASSQPPDAVIISVLPQKLVPIDAVFHQRRADARRAVSRPDLEQRVDLGDTSSSSRDQAQHQPPPQKNEMLRLERRKPRTSATNTLASSMGLQFG